MILIEAYPYKKISDDVEIMYTEHSQVTKRTTSKYDRIGVDKIYNAMEKILPTIIKFSKELSKNPDKEKRRILVKDYSVGFDYQFFVNKKDNGSLAIIINTSIQHPAKLFNPYSAKEIIVDTNGNITIKENMIRTDIIRKILNETLKI